MGLIHHRGASRFAIQRIVLVSLCTGVPAALGTLVVGLFSVHPTPAQLRTVYLAYAPLAATLFLLWLWWLRRATEPLRAYLRAPATPPADLPALQRRVHLLPYQIGLSKLLVWGVGAAALGVMSSALLHAPTSSALLLSAEAILLILGAALYEIPWHRATLAPLSAQLALRPELQQGEGPGARSALSLRRKMLLAFGTLTLFACGLALLWSARQHADAAQSYLRHLQELRGHAPGLRPDLLPSPNLGWRSDLLPLFLLLLGGSVVLLVLLTADLSRPIRDLEDRASAIARGELGRGGRPMAVEGDEIGRLYHTLEELRQHLDERLRSSTEIHLALEGQVLRRTAELERRNRELQEALAALQKAQEELLGTERMVSVGRLLAGIAHEINNPVNAVLNAAGPFKEALLELSAGGPARGADRDLLADAQDMLRVVQRGARRTKEIVQALHHYTRGDGGAPARVDLHRCLDESLELLQHDLRSGVRVERAYHADAPLAVLGYAGQLQQVFMNLLTNAAQALRGAPAPAIRIATYLAEEGEPRGHSAVVEISDNGPGIAPEVLPRIFDPFFTTKEVGQGTGLGLSIVHGIIERHRGVIQVDSALLQGTRIRVRLPAL